MMIINPQIPCAAAPLPAEMVAWPSAATIHAPTPLRRPGAMQNVVLWGNHFDAELAVTFVARLRAARLPVQIVGLHGRWATGTDGIVLRCDQTLGDLLPFAAHCTSITLPCHAPRLLPLDQEPRLQDLYRQAAAAGAYLYTGRLAPDEELSFLPPSHRIHICERSTTYLPMADDLARRLLGLGDW